MDIDLHSHLLKGLMKFKHTTSESNFLFFYHYINHFTFNFFFLLFKEIVLVIFTFSCN